jgi:hypothetical protein
MMVRSGAALMSESEWNAGGRVGGKEKGKERACEVAWQRSWASRRRFWFCWVCGERRSGAECGRQT